MPMPMPMLVYFSNLAIVLFEQLVKTGDIFDRAKIVRVDRGAGLLIEIPSVPVSTPSYVCVCSQLTGFAVDNHKCVYHTICCDSLMLMFTIQISDVADNKAQKLDKQFQEGSNVRVRVFGFRHLEGLAIGVLKVAVILHYESCIWFLPLKLGAFACFFLKNLF